ncbi:Longitudinals lacking protein, isoform G [Armadillidium nasatum]|uniref:Longitudinals lacking protein, isoform G n=1 Tax=Armadillidium nasatum TaxID=96803 RepID=A0A5N5SUC4_9CRUS|nr:Longitudinals lacking protein, isoform G [Armadillidium nasatum]
MKMASYASRSVEIKNQLIFRKYNRLEMEDGLLSLKWNNHKSTFFHILSGLRKKLVRFLNENKVYILISETYTDATLACEGRFFPVHKLVMSTCSDYFCEVFENTNCKSPVVILKDIKHHDLEALLDYMYLGEVDVKQNELAGLIKAAECLRIKGLAVPDEDPALLPKKTHIPENRLSPSAKRARRENVSDASSCSNLNHHSHSPSRSHSSTISTSVPSQSVNSDTPSQVPSLSLPPYTDKRHSSLSVSDNQKHIDQSDIVPVEMIKVEVDDENSNNSQLQQSKDRPIGQSGAKDDGRGEGSGNNNIEESHRDRENISNNFSDYSAGNQSTDIEKEEHDQIDPFNESDQVAGPSGVQGIVLKY